MLNEGVVGKLHKFCHKLVTMATSPRRSENELEISGKAQRDSPVLMLLAPPGKCD